MPANVVVEFFTHPNNHKSFYAQTYDHWVGSNKKKYDIINTL